MTARYFVDTRITGSQATIAGPEAHHLSHVMRATAGTEVVLFDGGGAEFTARVERIDRAKVELSIQARHDVSRELPFHVTLAVALPKGDRQRWLVEKAVELGVASLVPLVTSRGVTQPTQRAGDRLRRAVIEASKQCGRNRLMEIVAPSAVEPFLTAVAPSMRRLLAHPRRVAERAPPAASCRSAAPPPSEGIALAVGPEGGFTSEEVAAAGAAGWRIVDLGPRVLRVETAAILLVAAALAERGVVSRGASG